VAVLTVNLSTVDTFNPNVSQMVSTIALQPDRRLLDGDQFLRRLNPDGTLDLALQAYAAGSIAKASSIAVQPNGKILFGYGSALNRDNPDGTPDITFPSFLAANGVVNSIMLQADGKILVAGSLGSLVRLNADGTADTGFNPNPNGAINTIQMQGDGKIIVGGKFTSLGGQPRNYIGRLNSDGTADSTFNPSANATVNCLALQADGKILVGGTFSLLDGQSRYGIGRLNSDGSLDTGFNPSGGQTDEFAVQADGKILVGGQFSALCGQSRNNIGRLNADGSVDTTFNPGASSGVWSIELQEDGKILAGGAFTSLGGIGRNYIGRLNNTDPATESLTYDGANIIWLRGGTLPEVWRTTFEQSTDGTNWTMLGAGTRIAGGWCLSGVAIKNGTIRARGYSTGGDGWSCGLVESSGLGSLLIASQPVNWSLNPGQSATFGVGVVGSLPLNYQWYKGGTPLTDGGNVAGSSTANMTLGNAQSGDAGNYFVVISNTSGSVTSSVANLMVINDPMIASQPVGVTNNVGTSVTFSATASGTTPLGYQWSFNGVSMPGATNAALILPNIQFSDAGTYSVLVSNSSGAINCMPATLCVLQQPVAILNPCPSNSAMNVQIITNLTWSSTNFYATELILNGGFESGSMNNWTQLASRHGTQFNINDGTFVPPYGSDGAMPPYNGSYDAVGATRDRGEPFGMYQKISVPTNVPTVALSWAHRVRDFTQPFSSTEQFQVLICDTNDSILATAFSTKPGDTMLGDWVQNNYDMTAFAGQTVLVMFSVRTTGAGILNVYVDDVSVKIGGSTAIVTNDVYFGTNPIPGPAEYQGSTTNTTWALPSLSSQTTYYWQIITHNGGTSIGPVWQFTTAGATLLPPQNFGGHPVSGGGLQLQFSGTPNYPYVLQMTTDLTPPVNWQSILTNPADGSGNWSFTVTNLTDLPAGYYRAVGQ
jgi:uncharacterized delta-60 repeat protein